MTLRRDSLDALFSNYVRARDNYTCQRCAKYYEPPTRAIHSAHIFSRSHKGLRWNPDNAIALCHGCHVYFGGNPLYFKEWIVTRIGTRKYEVLMYLARKPTKYTRWDREIIRQDLKARLKALGDRHKAYKPSVQIPC